MFRDKEKTAFHRFQQVNTGLMSKYRDLAIFMITDGRKKDRQKTRGQNQSLYPMYMHMA